MKYLYGDSAPFPLGINFLATLEAFMTSATRAVELELRAGRLVSEAADVSRARVKELEALESFHTIVMRAIGDTAVKVNQSVARDYANKVGEFAARFVEEQKQATSNQNEREGAHAQTESARLRGELSMQLEAFFRAAELPQGGTELSMQLNGTSYEAGGVYATSHGIVSAFTLDVSRVPAWGHPRKVSELASNLDLRVGVKKSWIKGTVSTENVRLDDWIIGDLEFDELRTTISLRRKVDQKDALVFKFTTAGGQTIATVDHPGDPNADAVPGEMDPSDLPSALAFVAAVREAASALLPHKSRLVFVRLDGTEVTQGPVIPVVQRLVAMLAPTVLEIAQRSPSAYELSLKRESNDGRREELYLRKEELASKLQPLPAVGRHIFAPLGLENWLPSVTAAPPPVAPASALPTVIIPKTPPPIVAPSAEMGAPVEAAPTSVPPVSGLPKP